MCWRGARRDDSQARQVLDASAKPKGHCQRCNKTVTEDEVWVNALDKTFHKKCALLH